MGRDRRNENREQHFAKLLRTTMETPAWKALSPAAQALYPWLRLEWHGPEFNNNGKIRFSARQAAEALGVGRNCAARLFQELQAKGFIVVTEPGRMGVQGQARGPAYELTEISLPHGEKKEGRKLYLNWEHGADFAVIKGRANNPDGRNQKTEPCHQNEDGHVIKMRTYRRSASPK